MVILRQILMNDCKTLKCIAIVLTSEYSITEEIRF